MVLDIFQEFPEAVPQEKADRQPCGVGGQPQNIEGSVPVQQRFVKLDRETIQQVFYHALELFFRVAAL